jgi:hypothetical protein
MNIAQSLKEKNRIAGRIHKLQNQLRNANRYLIDEEQDFKASEIYKNLQEEWAHLINIKTKIAHANLGIVDKLVQLAEAKAELSFWTGFTSYAGKAEESVPQRRVVGGQYEDHYVSYTSYITSKEAQEHIDRVQKLIEDLQDEIDAYNGSTSI